MSMMTPQEIVKSYKQADDKKKQLRILSELNACSRKFIRTILIEGGIPADEIPHIRSTHAELAYESGETARREREKMTMQGKRQYEEESRADRKPVAQPNQTQEEKPAGEKKAELLTEVPPEVVELAKNKIDEIKNRISELTKQCLRLQKFVDECEKPSVFKPVGGGVQ